MRKLLRSIRQFLSELRRRNVYRVAVTYVVVGFFVIEGADLTLTRLGLPGWTVTLVVVLVGVGFPIALVMAWALEVTPEGVRVEEPESSQEELQAPTSTRDLWVGASVLVLLLLGAWWLLGGLGGGEATDQAREIDERSIAVLPFEALGKEKPGVFTEGMHDDLLTRLSNVSDLKVISRTAVQQYRNTDLTTGEIADSLGVRWVMEGGVQEMGDQIQVNAQLIDPRSETHVWAEDYQRDLTAEDLFAIQEDITRKIASALQAKLTEGEQKRITDAPTENLEAYRLYVKGRSQLDTRTEDGMRRSIKYFQQALQEDSTFALAWSGLADAQGLSDSASDSLGASVPPQKKAAQRALNLDPDLAEAHASMGHFHISQQNAPAALRHLKHSVKLKPSYAQAHHWLGWLYVVMGRLDLGLEHLSRAVELNPNLETARQAFVAALVAKGKTQKGKAYLRGVQSEGTRIQLKALLLHHSRRWDKLKRVSQKALSSEEGPPVFWHFHLARVAVERKDMSGARKHVEAIGEEPEGGPGLFYAYKGSAHAVIGETDSAFLSWQKIQEWPNLRLVHVFRHLYPNLLDLLREDPRYKTLIEKINRQWGLNSDGTLPEETDMLTTPTDR